MRKPEQMALTGVDTGEREPATGEPREVIYADMPEGLGVGYRKVSRARGAVALASSMRARRIGA